MRAILFLLLFPALGFTQQPPANPTASVVSENTLYVECQGEKPKQVLSPVWLSEDEKWRAYVQVDAQGEPECLHTTRLWVASASSSYRLAYFIPPYGDAVENGMEILGFANHSSLMLVRTEEWQWASDALPRQKVLAISAGTGKVYEPDLNAMLQRDDKEICGLRVLDAGFSADESSNILIRAGFFSLESLYGPAEEELPPAKRCLRKEETWSLNLVNGDAKQVANAQPLQLFKRSLFRRDN